MKKKITVCIILLVFAVFLASSYSRYDLRYDKHRLSYYYGDGWAGATYCGTTKNLTIDEVHNERWNHFYDSSPTPTAINSLSGKLSKRQSRLLWDALGQYNYAAGEIYSITFSEIDNPIFFFYLSVQIEPDGSCTWKGFSIDLKNI